MVLFTYYLVADGPRLRRTVCSRLPPARQERVLHAWELAITKTGGYLYSRALLALLSAFFHWIVFQAIGTPAPVALALWVGLVSQFLPVVGTYLAGILPALLDLPRFAAQGGDRGRVHRRVPADRELRLRAAHHGANDGAPSGRRVRRRPRRRVPARCRRRGARPSGGRDDAGVGGRMGQAIRRRRQPPDHRCATPTISGPRRGTTGRPFPANPPDVPRIGDEMTRFDDAFGPLAVATRSGFEESLFHGAAVALGADGSIIASVGDPNLPVYPRSALKPHAGDRDDRARPRRCRTSSWRSCARATTDVACTPMRCSRFSLDSTSMSPTCATRRRTPTTSMRVTQRSVPVSRRRRCVQNCSGKHAGMLATCRINGWSIADYLEPGHRLQMAITRSIEAHGAPVHHVGVDGCGAPTHVIGLVDLARAFAADRRLVDRRGRRDDGPPRPRRRGPTRHHALDAGPARPGGEGRCRRGDGGSAAGRSRVRAEGGRRVRRRASGRDRRRRCECSASTSTVHCRGRSRRPVRSCCGHGHEVGQRSTRCRWVADGVPDARSVGVHVRRGEPGGPARATCDRREPVEVHLPRHGHLHRRRATTSS